MHQIYNNVIKLTWKNVGSYTRVFTVYCLLSDKWKFSLQAVMEEHCKQCSYGKDQNDLVDSWDTLELLEDPATLVKTESFGRCGLQIASLCPSVIFQFFSFIYKLQLRVQIIKFLAQILKVILYLKLKILALYLQHDHHLKIKIINNKKGKVKRFNKMNIDNTHNIQPRANVLDITETQTLEGKQTNLFKKSL